MSNFPSHLADNTSPPLRSAVLVVDCPAATPVAVDLQSSSNRPASTDRLYWHNRYVSIQADGNAVYFFFAKTTGGGDPDETITGIAATTCVKIPADGVAEVLIPQGSDGLPSTATDQREHVLKFQSPAGCKVRIWASSPKGGV